MENRTKRKRKKKVGRRSRIEKKIVKKYMRIVPRGPRICLKGKRKEKERRERGGEGKRKLRTRIKRIIYQERVKTVLIMK